ncbi:AraC family transcriptional regulator [Consotaella aegiceratis]|uniref:AraC family transcriptional regulator n=1 Tax=Consotaella aegiceratis TaxID=3097961 RepID=UPI002F3E72B4
MGNSVLSDLTANGPVMRTLSLPRGRHSLHAMPTNAGYDHVSDPSYSWDGRQRGETPFSVLQHTLSGQGRLDFDRRHHRVSTGQTMLVTIPHDHRYWLAEGKRWEFFWIAMHGQEALRIIRTVTALRGPVLQLAPETVEHLARRCRDLVATAQMAPGRASAIAYEVVMALYDDVIGPHADAVDATQGGAIAAVTAYIRAHLDTDLDVGRLASLAGFSRAHFTRLFTAAEGVSPAEYVLTQRMRRAARLLEVSTMPVKAIAAACGFVDPNYFAKAFRRTFGISPTDFRTTGMYATTRHRPAARG